MHLRLEPDSDELLRRIATAKDELGVNVELASPLPEPSTEIRPDFGRM